LDFFHFTAFLCAKSCAFAHLEVLTMAKNDRAEELRRLIDEEGYLSIQTLARKTYTSPSTVRRDLAKLEQQGYIRRRHGGAESLLTVRPPLPVRQQSNPTEKASAARRAAALVAAGSTIFLDPSTTAQYMIPHLAGLEGLTVYTNGADTALRLAEAGVRVVSTGGELSAKLRAYSGPVAEAAVRRVNFDAMFFSTAGFDEECVSDWSESETALRRAVMEHSARRYLLSDHTKRGQRFTHVVCLLSELDDLFCE
jgi:DeoR family fructose operon transcriptional repressor